jgi:hypothetical protein
MLYSRGNVKTQQNFNTKTYSIVTEAAPRSNPAKKATQRELVLKKKKFSGSFHCVKLKADYSRTLNQIPRVSQGFPCLSWNTKIHNRTHKKNPPLVIHVLGRMNLVETLVLH